MDEPSSARGPNAYGTYAIVAFISAMASVVIALIALTKFTQVTDGAMWAMAVMVLAPSLLGVGVSCFVYMTSSAASQMGAARYQSLQRGAAADAGPPRQQIREGGPNW